MGGAYRGNSDDPGALLGDATDDTTSGVFRC
jgi:hypothetical protein